MFKLSAVSAALFVASISAASAADCVSYDGLTDVFTSSCESAVVIEYRTVNGGCFMTERAKFTLNPGQSSSQLLLSESCGNGDSWTVDWVACDSAEYNSGQCKLSF